MKQYLIVIIVILTVSCSTKVIKEHFSYPDRKEIIEIVQEIVNGKKIPVIKVIFPTDTILDENQKKAYRPIRHPLTSDLQKLFVFLPDTTINGIDPPQLNGINVRKLLSLSLNDKPFFSKNDSTFFLFQNDTVKVVDLNDELNAMCFLTTSKKQEALRKQQKHVDYYEFSVPIFSRDFKKAYVEVYHYCTGLCGSGSYLLLEKRNAKWSVVDEQLLWIS